MANKISIVAVLDDKVSSGLTKIRDKLDTIGGKGTGAVAFGVIAAKGLGLMASAADGVVNALGDLVTSGLEGEKSQARLLASLKANIPGFKGNTDAIERQVTANQNLGFSDDETKDSLARLVAATHDVGKAMAIQAVAMDLARFKGISLSDATDALTKVEAGSYRILKSLGIELKNGATQTEALAAVEKIASGQAAAYAETTGGKLLVAQTKFGDAMQRLGEDILPIVATGLDDLEKGLQVLGHMFDAATPQIGDFTKKQINLAEASKETGKSIQQINDEINHGIDPLTGFTKAQYDAAKGFDTSSESAGNAARSLAGVGTAATGAADATDTSMAQMTTSVDQFAAAAKKDTDAVAGYYNTLITGDRLAATNAAIAADKKIIASGKATAAIRADLHQQESDQAQELADLATAGATSSKSYTSAVAGLLARLRTAHGAERDMLQSEIDSLKQLEYAAKRAAQALRFDKTGRPFGNPTATGHAEGGWVGLGGPEVVTVGEKGPEYVIPNNQLASAGATGGGTTVHTVINLDGRQIAAIVDYYNASSLGRAAPTLGRI
jgi:hypothetical protein